VHSVLVSFKLNFWELGFTNVPRWGAVKRLGGVMVALAMATHIKDLVLDVSTALTVQAEDFVLEALPLGFLVFGVVLAVCVVRLINKTKVCGCLQVESGIRSF
jgi:hypothetical protein